jgi:hypothetical protein
MLRPPAPNEQDQRRWGLWNHKLTGPKLEERAGHVVIRKLVLGGWSIVPGTTSDEPIDCFGVFLRDLEPIRTFPNAAIPHSQPSKQLFVLRDVGWDGCHVG